MTLKSTDHFLMLTGGTSASLADIAAAVADINGPGGAGDILSFSVSIDADQLTTLNSSPVSVGIANPGAGKRIAPVSAYVQKKSGASTFGSNRRIHLVYTGDTTAIFDCASPQLNSTEDAVVAFGDSGNPILDVDPSNKGLSVQMDADLGVYGPITAITVNDGGGGTGYAVGDLFSLIDSGNGDAIGIVTAESEGVVTSVAITGAGTAPGTSYTTGNGLGTAVVTGGGDDALGVNVTVSTPGTGTLQIDGTYMIVDAIAP